MMQNSTQGEPRMWERVRFWAGIILGCGIMLALIWRDL
jgi:hypothetical protein